MTLAYFSVCLRRSLVTQASSEASACVGDRLTPPTVVLYAWFYYARRNNDSVIIAQLIEYHQFIMNALSIASRTADMNSLQYLGSSHSRITSIIALLGQQFPECWRTKGVLCIRARGHVLSKALGGTEGAPPLGCLLMLLHFIFILLMEIPVGMGGITVGHGGHVPPPQDFNAYSRLCL